MSTRSILLAIAVGTTLATSLASADSPTEADVARRLRISVEEVKLIREKRGIRLEQLALMSRDRAIKILGRIQVPLPENPLAAGEFMALMETGSRSAKRPDGAIEKAISQTAIGRARALSAATRPVGADVRTIASGQLIEIAGIPVADTSPRGLSRAGDPRAAGMDDISLEPLLPLAKMRNREPGDLSPRRWNWLGPTNIGGRTRAIVLNPRDPSIIYAAGVSGGIWKSINAGQSWAPLADFMASINVTSLVLDPAHPDTIYAGTGEFWGSREFGPGLGVFRSTDGGASWTRYAATREIPFVWRIAVTTDGGAMLLATSTGIFRSTNFRDANAETVTFTRAGQPHAQVHMPQVVCSSKDAQHCVAGSFLGTAMVSRDAGATWTLATGFPAVPAGARSGMRIELAISAANTAIVYASVDRNLGELFRSDDGGQTFSARSTGSNWLGSISGGTPRSQGWYANAIWAGDPTRPDLVVVGGLDIFRSVDGGRTLTWIADWTISPRSPHADHHIFTAHPGYNGTTNRTVYFGNDGGIYRHDNIIEAEPTRGWVLLNNNYGVTQFYSVAGDPASGRIVGGTQDNGTLVYDPPGGAPGPDRFRRMYGGDGSFAAIDPTDPNFVYGATQFLGLVRSRDGGFATERISEGVFDTGSSSNFIAPFILDPHNSNVMFGGGESLWRTREAKGPRPAWQQIKLAAEGASNFVSAIEAARSAKASGAASDLLWVGHNTGDIYHSANADAREPDWAKLDVKALKLPARAVTRIRVSPHDRAVVHVAYAGFTKDNLWRTRDNGKSWQSIHGTLPGITVRDVAVHPANPRWLYAATHIGLFASSDEGATWTATNRGPANVSVHQLFWMGERLVVATHGRGIYWIDLSGATPVAAAPPPAGPPAAAPPPAAAAPPPAAPPVAAQPPPAAPQPRDEKGATDLLTGPRQ
jgi:photosystem II stability/assembly factor-like uncharacterized protein